jgi:pre-60S factor REI1
MDTQAQPLFTCLSCSIAFLSANEQRAHYQSDHHRYNMKRRVASLSPVSVSVFNQKVLERRAETAVTVSPKGSTCKVCSKVYSTENAYLSHMKSKKHRENELNVIDTSNPRTEETQQEPVSLPSANASPATALSKTTPPEPLKNALLAEATLSADLTGSEDEITRTIDEKITAARAHLSPNQCLFCPNVSTTFEGNLTHMSIAHSFFVPDADYLNDLTGLIIYLGEKIAVGNVCIYCNEKGREFRTLAAVRKHMLDKGHCKIAYDSEDDRLEISDYYDFTSSYPDGQLRAENKVQATKGDDIWEDVEGGDDESVDEVIEEESDGGSDGSLPETQITYGDSNLELILPSGTRIGHRSMRRYYAQSFPGTSKSDDPNSGAGLVRRLLADKNSALVPRKGGFGAYGSGTEVVKARNRGEAREAGRHVREFRDQKRREIFKTKVGFIHNNQKHFRDPLLQ